MRFIHISDTHLGPTEDYAPRGVPALATARQLVQTLNNLPFQPDFVLHTGDVVNDGSDAAYELAKGVFADLKYPIYYLVGNHDLAQPLQRVMLGKQNPTERYDYYVERNGIGLAVFDTRGPVDPAGTMIATQLATLRDMCRRDGPPLIIAIHHQPIKLDAAWLDDEWPNGLSMPMDCADEFRDALAPARDRIRGVFFGHVHRGFQAIQDGIFYCSAPSAAYQYESWPGQPEAIYSPSELPGYGVVTISDKYTLVRQYTFPKP